MIHDINNNIIQIGDIVKVEGSPIKVDNAVYVVVQDGTSKLYSGSGLTMYRVAKHSGGYTLSKASNSTCFYPLVNFSNRYKFSREEMAAATIEILEKAKPERLQVVKSNNDYEPEGGDKDCYHAAVVCKGEKIEDVSYLITQAEKLTAFFSNLTLKAGQELEVRKQSDEWRGTPYWKGFSYELKETEQSGQSQTETPELPTAAGTSTAKFGDYNLTIIPDTDTRDGSKMWVVKISQRLARNEYIKVAEYMESIGGYYSKFKKGFIFRSDPTDTLRKIA